MYLVQVYRKVPGSDTIAVTFVLLTYDGEKALHAAQHIGELGYVFSTSDRGASVSISSYAVEHPYKYYEEPSEALSRRPLHGDLGHIYDRRWDGTMWHEEWSTSKHIMNKMMGIKEKERPEAA